MMQIVTPSLLVIISFYGSLLETVRVEHFAHPSVDRARTHAEDKLTVVACLLDMRP